MSDIQPSTSQAGDAQAKPKDLRALVQDMGHWRHAPEGGVNLIIISVTAALPETKRTPELIAQIGEGVIGISAKRNGTVYAASAFDFGIMVKVNETVLVGMVRDLKVDMLRTIERNFPGSFGTIDQSRLVLSYDLVNNYRSAADRVAKYAEIAQRAVAETDAGGDKQLRPLTTADIKNVMRAYEKFGNEKFIKAFVRSQDVMMNIAGKPPESVMTEASSAWTCCASPYSWTLRCAAPAACSTNSPWCWSPIPATCAGSTPATGRFFCSIRRPTASRTSPLRIFRRASIRTGSSRNTGAISGRAAESW